ncbi:motor axon guidance molcule sidestep [Arctopsyche grandis]|uniref:motor axon guidance molcule sidestep n=1 Tax=Arctopsyche grandis TaxID=121162 RepID=UPI00406D719D
MIHSGMHLIALLLAALCVGCHCYVEDSAESDRNVAHVVWAATGGEAFLPCDASLPTTNDEVSMIMWFKDSVGMPFYSLDFRGRLLEHLVTTDDLGSRTHFILEDKKPEDAHLIIRAITRSDEGVFRCRIDFFNSPTRNYKVNLSLIIPPSEPIIFNGQGVEVSGTAGPFIQEYDLSLSCQVNGGRPKPEVTWWHDSILLDGIEDTSSREGVVVSQLFIGTVTRSLYGAKFQCRAHVSHLIPPVVKDIQLQVYLKPMFVRILSSNERLSSGKPHTLRCETLGSHPAARLSWVLNGEVIRTQPITVTNAGNATSSIATLILAASDDGKDLTCRATNPYIPGAIIEDRRTLSVSYPPVVTLTVGSSEDPKTLKEGRDVQLICNTEAKPPVDKYAWYRDQEQLNNNPSEGLVVLGRTMRIRNLTREDSGNYSCKASNSEGDVLSQTLTINVLYVPVCKAGPEASEIAALRHTPTPLRCDVDSPADAGLLKFSWTFNKTRNFLRIPPAKITSSGSISEHAYTPMTADDFGTVACWATNSVGNQKYPCLFNIVPAKIPDAPRECNLVNNSVPFEVICRPGANGGIPQHFLLEVLDGVQNSIRSTLPPINNEENEISTMNDQGTWPASNPVTLYKETGDSPRFALRGLRPGHKYGLLVYAVNAKGKSSPAIIQDITVPESLADYFYNLNSDKKSNGDEFNLSPHQSMVMILGAVIAAAFLIVIAIIVATSLVLCRRRTSSSSGFFGCGSDKRQSGCGPSMYSAPEDENGFAHFGTPNVMIRPCADIRRDSRRASRALSSLIASQEDPLVMQAMPVQDETDNDSASPNAELINPQLSRMGSIDIQDPELDRRRVQFVPYSVDSGAYPEEVIYQAPNIVGYHPMTHHQLQRIASLRQSLDVQPRGSRDFGVASSDAGSESSNLGSRNSVMPMYVPAENSGLQMVQMISPPIYCLPRNNDQILRFSDNNIARVEISNKDVGTVVRFELSKPDLISQENIQKIESPMPASQNQSEVTQ